MNIAAHSFRFPSRAERRAMRNCDTPNPSHSPTLRAADEACHPVSSAMFKHEDRGDDGSRLHSHCPQDTVPAADAQNVAAGTLLLPGTGAGGSIERVLKQRLAMIEAGDTPKSDLRAGRGCLIYKANFHTKQALAFTKTPQLDADRKAYRFQLAKAAAYLLGEIDRTDLELEQRND